MVRRLGYARHTSGACKWSSLHPGAHCGFAAKTGYLVPILPRIPNISSFFTQILKMKKMICLNISANAHSSKLKFCQFQ